MAKAQKFKELRGFLGVTSYYRRFIKGYASIVASMIDLLKKDSFNWGDEATLSFDKLKLALATALVLIDGNRCM